MKKFIFAVLFACISACSSRTSAPTPLKSRESVGVSSAMVQAVLANTTDHPPPLVFAALANQLSQKLPLANKQAEACWQRESARPEVARACLLAWSTGQLRSSALEAALLQEATKSRIAAVAVIRHQPALLQLNFAQLTEVLGQLSPHDPVWLRAEAIRVWVKNRPGIHHPDVAQLKQYLVLGDLPSPVDLHSVYLAFQALDSTAAVALAQQYCSPLAGDDFRLRCWRFLSTFAGDSGEMAFPEELADWLPAGEKSWQLFRLSLPNRARLLEKTINAKE